MANPVVHFEVIGKDPKALEEFYHQAFDWTMQSSSGAGVESYTLVHAQAGGHGIDGGIGGPVDGYAGHATFYVAVPNVDATLKTIERLGGTRIMGPEQVPGNGPVIALFSDPEGHVVGLVQGDASQHE